MQGGLGGQGEVEDRRDLHVCRQQGAQFRQFGADGFSRGHRICLWSLADLHGDRAAAIEPGSLVLILLTTGNLGHVGQSHRRAVLHGNQ